MCRNQKILLWGMKRKNSSYISCKIGIKDFKRIRKITRKTKCKVEIKNKKGLPFLFEKYKKRKIFLLMMCIIIASLIVLSQFVWNVEVKINGSNLKEEDIINTLTENGLYIGERKNKIDVKEIVNKVRLDRSDISWIGIEIKGTNAIVQVVEAEKKPEIANDDDYCNIVSNKEGKILKITANNGTAMVKPGDIVKEGTLLIAGWIEGKYTGTRLVRADGNIEANVWYTETGEVSLEEKSIEKTGNTEKKYALKINNFRINLYKKLSNFEKYDTIYTSKKIKIFSNFYLPVELIECNNFEIQEKNVKYSVEEAKNEAKRRAEEKSRRFRLAEGEKIPEKADFPADFPAGTLRTQRRKLLVLPESVPADHPGSGCGWHQARADGDPGYRRRQLSAQCCLLRWLRHHPHPASCQQSGSVHRSDPGHPV